MNRRTFLTSASTATLAVIAGCGANSTSEASNLTTATPEVVILNHQGSYDWLGATVSGTVQNTTDRVLDYIQVNATFYDDQDTRIGDGMWNATDVQPGTKVSFETIPASTGEHPARYFVEAGTSL